MALRKRNTIVKTTKFQIGVAGYSCKIYQMSNGNFKWVIYDFDLIPIVVNTEITYEKAYEALKAEVLNLDRGTLRQIKQ